MELLKPNERIDYMYNDDLQIIQEKDAFSFSLDTLLLGYFAQNKIHDNYKVVDLCSGNGLLVSTCPILTGHIMMQWRFKKK